MSEVLPVVYMARHGNTAWTLSGQHTSLTDLPLTPDGERNAQRLGERLKGNYCRIRSGNLEGGTVPHPLETQPTTDVPNGPAISPLAGKPAPKEMFIDPARLEKEYFERRPDLSDRDQLVNFGTTSWLALHGTFSEAHILAITQAICDYRRGQGTDGPYIYGGKIPMRFPRQRSILRRHHFERMAFA